MGILQTAYRTYENQAHRAGKAEENQEPLTPLSHAILNAQIEIVLDSQGAFQSAHPVPKAQSKTIVPVTIDSANRVGEQVLPHSLSDQLQYLAPFGGDKFEKYIAKLKAWADSEFSHPKVRAVLAYIQGGTILDDLAAAGVITLDNAGNLAKAKIEGYEYSKCLVRWRVQGLEEKDACWEDTTLFERYIAFYAVQLTDKKQDICFITGQTDMVCYKHPKGVISANFGAKLASANDDSGYTYRGRFATADEAYCIGYAASQKAHHALRWVASNQGVVFGGRTFICWNPEGVKIPSITFFGIPNNEAPDFVSYKQQLYQTLSGFKESLPDTHDVVISAFDAATTGRLSVTYYNELKASDFLDRIRDWYSSLCWQTWFGIYTPTLKRIAECAFGTERNNFFEVDNRVLRERVQQLLHCMLDKQPLSTDVVQALVSRAGTPLAYSSDNRERLLSTACAVVRKYRNDKFKEEWNLALDTSTRNRSYLFGRLLAVAEQVERCASDFEEGRETNAIRIQTVFAQRPMYAWRILEEKLNPYYQRLQPGLRAYFKNIIGEIMDMLDLDDPNLGKKLEDTYLLGYYHQRTAMTRKKEAPVKEDNHESVEK